MVFLRLEEPLVCCPLRGRLVVQSEQSESNGSFDLLGQTYRSDAPSHGAVCCRPTGQDATHRTGVSRQRSPDLHFRRYHVARRLAIVITHNVWEPNWRVLITLFGWIVVFAGIGRLALPEIMKSVGNSMIENPAFTIVPGALMAVLGAFLSYHGYLT